MTESEEKLIKAIKHYQESLDRHTKTENTDKLLHGIEKLGKLSIKVCHLEQTGVGRTVNGLKRFDGLVGESARNLVDKWKLIVKGEEEEEQRLQKNEKNEPEKLLVVAENSDSDNSSSKKIKKSEHSEKRRSRSRDRKSSNSDSKKKSSHKSSSDDSDSDSKKKKKKSSKRTESSESSDSSRDRKKRHKSSSKDKKKHKDKKSKERHSSPEKKRKREQSPEKQSKKHKKDSSEKTREKSKDRKSEKPPSLSKSNKSSSPTASTSKKNVSNEKLVNGIDSESGASFADVLNMLGSAPVVKSSKKRVSAPESVEKSSTAVKEKESARSSSKSYQEPRNMDNDEEEVPNLLKQNPSNLEPLDINLSSLLPPITPNYRPLNAPLDGQNKKMWMDDEALSRVITAKHQRTKVYSGVKCGSNKVPTLFEICSRVLQDNLDALEYTGGVPYSILKPILDKANPDQLYQLEFHNPYLIEDSDELWQLHCQKEFRNKKREELESWRDMYMRCLDEREAKLKALTANIKQSQDKSVPVRQTKLAYVDSFVKPPRNIARKQAKNGTAMDVMKKPSQTPTERLSQLARSGEAGKTAVPNPVRVAPERAAYTPSNLKQKKAPLMAKALSVLKNRFGRR